MGHTLQPRGDGKVRRIGETGRPVDEFVAVENRISGAAKTTFRNV